MTRKRAIALLLALLLALTAAGCATATAPDPTPAPAATETPEPTATPAPTETPKPKKTLPPPPDVDITSWEFLYAGPKCGVGRYHPPVENVENQYMDQRCAAATREFLAAARAQGYTLYMCTAYRNFEYTIFWYEKAIRDYGSAYEACQHVFAAGCSEHSTGLAFDITDEMIYWADMNYSNVHDETVADTEVCQWMNEHCAEYGFIVRYPESRKEVYGMSCYPGHYRYVGREAAQYIMDNDICFEEFLALYGVYIEGINYIDEYEIAA